MNPAHIVEAAGLWAYAVVFAITAGETSAFIGVVLPGETVVLLAAALAGRGGLDPYLLAAAVVAGCVVGDSLGFGLGHWYEHRTVAERLRRRIKPGGRTARARQFLLRHGGPAVFTGRFIGFVRSFLPFAAGAAGMRYRRFLAYSAGASLLWGSANVLAGYFLGASAEGLLSRLGYAGAAGVAAVVVGALLAVRLRHGRKRERGTASGEPPRDLWETSGILVSDNEGDQDNRTWAIQRTRDEIAGPVPPSLR